MKKQNANGVPVIAHGNARAFSIVDNGLHYLLHIGDDGIDVDHYCGFTTNLAKRIYDIFIHKGPYVTRYRPFTLVALTDNKELYYLWKDKPYEYCKLCNSIKSN